jgi:hypothetical protein
MFPIRKTVVQVSLIPIKVEYVEWTLGSEGSGPKLRAPVYLGLRVDRTPEDCRLEGAVST